jgi:hypothetical protein
MMVRDLDSDLLILDTEANQIHQLNQTATFIWRRVEEAPSPERLAEMLAEAFGVDANVAQRDVLETLERFSALNLVVDSCKASDAR